MQGGRRWLTRLAAPLNNFKHLPFNRYYAVKTEYNGRNYHSKREAQHAQGLDLLLRAKPPHRIAAWQPQIRIPLIVNGTKICDYVCDFQITHLDGSIELQEVKGLWTPIAILKTKLFEATWHAEHPEVKFTVIR